MSQQAIFRASARARRTLSRNVYLLFGAGMVLALCGGGAVATLFAASEAPNRILVGLAAALACLGGAGLLGGLASLTRLRQPIQVEVTPHRLTWREGRRIATLEYPEVERVELVKDHKTTRSGATLAFPVVRFIEDDGEMMEFEISFEDRGRVHHARFDARGITEATLPHLPSRAVIDPAVREFVRTGEVDIDLLPAR